MRLLQRLSSLSLMQALVLAFAVKLVIACLLPVTGDEAYFVLWGRHLDFGYYDHPPMAGWMTWLQLRLSDHPVWVRMPGILSELLIALWLHGLFRRHDPDKARLLALLFLFSPLSLIFAFTLTDTGCMLFAAASFVAAARAVQSEQGRAAAGWAVLAGAGLGLAFLSKYFAALLGFAYAAHAFGWRRERWWAPFLIFVCALPAIALNVGFNATHGWSNVMFNVFNRNEASAWSFKTFATYVAMALYLFTPWLVWRALRSRPVAGVSATTRTTLAVLWLFPIVVFALLSTRRTIGLHWVLGFVPVFVLWAGLRVEPRALRRLIGYTVALSVPHLVGVLAIAIAPLSWWAATKLHDRAVFLRETPAVVAALRQDLPPGATLMARTYNPAAMLAFHHGAYVPVFGPGRHHARQDDQIIDFRTYDGKGIRVFLYDEPDLSEFAPYFERVSKRPIVVEGITFWAVDGTGFKFQPFRDQVLAQVARDFHDIPAWLPVLGNPFCERYGFVECGPGRVPAD